MRASFVLIAFLMVGVPLPAAPAREDNSQAIALSGRVTSLEEGAMEGVLVSAKKAGSTITVTVVSDEQGRYRFPASKLSPGNYALRVRAVGYDLESPSSVEVGSVANADLQLPKSTDLAAQLPGAAWFASL